MSMLKVLLIGGGAFALYEWWVSQSTNITQVSTTTGGTSIAPTGTTTSPTTTLTKAQINTLLGINEGFMVQAVKNSGNPIISASTLYNVSQWNWFLTNATGIPGQFLGDDGSAMLVSQYVPLLQNWAKNQIGVGMIISLNPIYGSRQTASGFGDEEFLASLSNGLGMLIDAPENSASYIDEGPMIAGAGRNGSLDSSTRAFYLADGYQG